VICTAFIPPCFTVAIGEVDDRPVVVSGGDDNSVRLWDARSGKRLSIVLQVRSNVFGLAIAKDFAIAVVTKRGILMLDILHAF
jgi:WD40 repeat protein